MCFVLSIIACPIIPSQPDVLEDLLAQFQAAHPDIRFPPVPKRGQLNVARVKLSRYFFS
jgi:DNA-directed RNA polymerase